MKSKTPALPVNGWVDAVYVLSVKSYDARIAHVRSQMAKHGIQFEFMFDYDVDALADPRLDAIFTGTSLSPGQKSLILKNIAVWRDAVAKNHQRILVLEDDVVLDADFVPRFAQAMEEARELAPGWLIFLGGKDAKVPDRYFLTEGALFALPIPTAEALVSDITALQRRLAWLEQHKIDLPADHLMQQIDEHMGTPQYWLTHPIVEQGSTIGLFTSHLDRHRQKHSLAFTRYRNYWNKFRRRWLRKQIIRTLAKLRLIPS